MLTYSKLGKKGNLGNQLFQIASTVGLAFKYKQTPALPEWKYSQYFENDLTGFPHQDAIVLKEPHFHHVDNWNIDVKGNYDLDGWLQSEKYWKDIEPEIRSAFQFKASVRNELAHRFEHVFEKPVIAISIRRGDYVGNPNYDLLPASYYYLALLQHFPDYQDYNILLFSDDMGYCRVQFECLPNVFYAEGCNDIEQLCLMTLCDHYIIANSTFSWWGAYLGEKEGTKIIRPNYLFAGPLLKTSDDKDFWPERWTIFDHKGKKLDLKDVTFTIPVLLDHMDRKNNASLSVCMLQRDFDTNIIIGEQGSNGFKFMNKWCRYKRFDEMRFFHRTKMLNDMAIMAETDIIANWDCDIFIPPLQVWLTVEAIRKDAEIVYPYDGRFARVPRLPWFSKIEKFLDIGIVGNTEFSGKNGKPLPVSSVGGSIFYNKDAFIDAGMENEYMISYGPEDAERWDRFHSLGMKVQRITGCLYHMDHWCGPNSSGRNPYFSKNHKELDKIRAMNPDQLRAYVDTWPWRHKYTNSYYTRISETAIISARETYAALRETGVKFTSIIDVGCGAGEWNEGSYTGIDYKVSKRSLMIPQERYIDINLETLGTKADNDIYKRFEGKTYDLALCLEVAEHISKDRAAALVGFLCSLSDRVLFSAAIPYQGGVGHVNEQWQSWWGKRFFANGYRPAKKQLREMIADNEKIDIWYRQNIVVYERDGKGSPVTDYVHPQMYHNVVSTLIGNSKKELVQV